jgi:ABC-type Zn uptake system ZnuABC Zn-binding protein ZnuA
MKLKRTHLSLLMFLLLGITLAACTQTVDSEELNPPDTRINVVATTTIVGDVVKNIGGDAIHLDVLLPVGTDPHSFQPTPQDVIKVTKADVIFMNGIGLEEYMESLLENADSGDRIVNVSEGVPLLKTSNQYDQDIQHETNDPHVWMDPNNVVVWVDNIEATLSIIDPENSTLYGTNKENYLLALFELDQQIRNQVAQIPESQRKLVTDHQVFGYFANRYGFNQVGTIIPGYSTLAEPSALDLAELEDNIRDLNVKVILVGNTVNPSLAERIAQDTGTQLVFVYTGSLTEPGGLADNYLDFIRYNTNAIISATK